MNNFFRKDLNLKNRWWHRFLLILFISLLFFSVALIGYEIYLYVNSHDFYQWKKISTLSNRIDSEINSVGVLIKEGEKIEETDSAYKLNLADLPYTKFILDNVYCSTKLQNQVEKIMKDQKVDHLFIQNLHGENDVSFKDFTNYIKTKDINCLSLDAYTTYFSDGKVSGKFSFLEPDKKFQDNWSFYKKSSTKTVFYFLKTLFILLFTYFVIFIGIIIIYYKIFLYIIFGSKNNDKKYD